MDGASDAARHARYPFLPEAGRWAADVGPDVEELLTDVAWERARRRAVERVESALEEAEVAPPASMATDQDRLIEVLSYAVARMLVSAVSKPTLTRRYALGEAKAAQRHLEGEGVVGLLEVARALGLEVQRTPRAGGGDGREGPRRDQGPGDRQVRDRPLAMHFTSYLMHLKGVREDRRRLVRQVVDDGDVLLDAKGFARMVQEAVRDKLLDELPLATSELIDKALAGEVRRIGNLTDQLAKRFEPEPLGDVRLELIPPCMKALLGQLQAGENVPHQGRFALTAFLHKVGMGSERIMELFSTAPDFKEAMTRYQVEHITGETSDTEYTPPSCATMVTYGLCVNKDALCEHINHPLSYYRVKYRDAPDRDEDGDAEAEGGDAEAGDVGDAEVDDGTDGDGPDATPEEAGEDGAADPTDEDDGPTDAPEATPDG